jgi:hypothetical protein
MSVGIDWVSAAIILGAFLFAQIRQVPPRIRYFGVAAALGAIAIYRFKTSGVGGTGVNQLMPFVALALCVYHVVKGLRSPR